MDMYTDLTDRQLWFDGTTVVVPSAVEKFITCSKLVNSRKLCTTEINRDITKYNSFVPDTQQVLTKDRCDTLSLEWNLPPEFNQLDVDEYVETKLYEECERKGVLNREIELNRRVTRTFDELKLYKEFGLIDTLRAIIYVINKFKRENVVWGVGRGSSVSSYVLYLLEVHDIDSIEYGLNVSEFLRP